MRIFVKKADEAEKARMSSMPEWECGVSEFHWFYDNTEVCLLTAGEVTVKYDGGSVEIKVGDLAEFPAGLDCVWNVSKPVKKNFFFK